MSYVKQNFEDGKVLKAAHLNYIEDNLVNIAKNSDKVFGKANGLVTEIIGDVVEFYPDEGNPFWPKTILQPVQAGSGEASPDNMRPITGHTGAKLTRCGKNLACSDVSSITSFGITVNRNGGSELVVYGTAMGTFGMEGFETLLPVGTYIYNIGDIGNITRFEISIDGTPIVQLFGNDSATFTLDSPAVVKLYMILYEGDDCGTEDNPTVVKAQLEIGSTATSYEPYQGNTYTLDFGQTVYGGTLDWGKGVLTVDMGYAVFNGSENWSVYTYEDGKTSFYTSGTGKLSGIADRFIYIPGLCSWSPTAEDGYIRDVLRTDVDSTEIEIKPDVLSKWGINDIDTFKTRLAANPMQIAYKLATPTTIQLTPQQILAIDGVNTVYSETGDVTVTYNKSLVKVVEELTNAIVALGGNI